MNRGHKHVFGYHRFRKAFNTVPHRRLSYNFNYYGKRGFVHKWINSCLSERIQHVSLISSPIAIQCARVLVLGSCLFLYLIFTNDLPDSTRSTARLFADDLVIYQEHTMYTVYIYSWLSYSARRLNFSSR